MLLGSDPCNLMVMANEPIPDGEFLVATLRDVKRVLEDHIVAYTLLAERLDVANFDSALTKGLLDIGVSTQGTADQFGAVADEAEALYVDDAPDFDKIG